MVHLIGGDLLLRDLQCANDVRVGSWLRECPVFHCTNPLMRLPLKRRQIGIESCPLPWRAEANNMSLDIVSRIAGNRNDDEFITAMEVVRKRVHRRKLI